MAKKIKPLKGNIAEDTPYDFEKDFAEFDEFDDFDVPDAKSRSPVENFTRSASAALAGSVINPKMYGSVAKSVLPENYGKIFDVADTSLGAVSEMYEDSVKQIKPHINKIARATNKLMPASMKRTKEALAKLTESTSSENYGSSYDPRQQREDSIGLAMAEAFKYQVAQSAEANAAVAVGRQVDAQINHKRHNDMTKYLAPIAEGIGSIKLFNENASFGYMRKTLEIMMRQLYALEDIKTLTAEQHKTTTEGFASVIKNTALPEVQKIKLHEGLTQSLRNNLYSRLGNSVFDPTSKIMTAIVTGLKNDFARDINDLREKLDDTTDLLDTANDFVENMQDSEEGVGGNLGGLVGSSAISGVVSLYKDKIRKKLYANPDGFAKKIVDFGIGANNRINDMGGFAKRIKSKYGEQLEDDYGDGILGMGKSLLKRIAGRALYHGVSNYGPQETLDNQPFDAKHLTEAANIDNFTKKSLEHVIPGFLSRILRQVTIRNYDVPKEHSKKVNLMVFDYESDSFKSTKDMAASIQEKFDLKTGSANATRAFDNMSKDLFSRVDPKHVTADAKRDLETLLREANIIGIMSDEHMLEDKDLQRTKAYKTIAASKERLAAVRKLFGKLMSNDETKANFVSNAIDVKQSVTDPRAAIDDYMRMGMSGILETMGLVKRNKRGSGFSMVKDKLFEKFKPELTGRDTTPEMDGRVTSDVYAKKDITQITNKEIGDMVRERGGKLAEGFGKLKSFNWTYKDGKGDGGTHSGPMAQSVSKELDDSQSSAKDAAAPNANSIDPISMMGKATAAVGWLSNEFNSLKQSVNSKIPITNNELDSDASTPLSVLKAMREDICMIATNSSIGVALSKRMAGVKGNLEDLYKRYSSGGIAKLNKLLSKDADDNTADFEVRSMDEQLAIVRDKADHKVKQVKDKAKKAKVSIEATIEEVQAMSPEELKGLLKNRGAIVLEKAKEIKTSGVETLDKAKHGLTEAMSPIYDIEDKRYMSDLRKKATSAAKNNNTTLGRAFDLDTNLADGESTSEFDELPEEIKGLLSKTRADLMLAEIKKGNPKPNGDLLLLSALTDDHKLIKKMPNLRRLLITKLKHISAIKDGTTLKDKANGVIEDVGKTGSSLLGAINKALVARSDNKVARGILGMADIAKRKYADLAASATASLAKIDDVKTEVTKPTEHPQVGPTIPRSHLKYVNYAYDPSVGLGQIPKDFFDSLMQTRAKLMEDALVKTKKSFVDGDALLLNYVKGRADILKKYPNILTILADGFKNANGVFNRMTATPIKVDASAKDMLNKSITIAKGSKTANRILGAKDIVKSKMSEYRIGRQALKEVDRVKSIGGLFKEIKDNYNGTAPDAPTAPTMHGIRKKNTAIRVDDDGKVIAKDTRKRVKGDDGITRLEDGTTVPDKIRGASGNKYKALKPISKLARGARALGQFASKHSGVIDSAKNAAKGFFNGGTNPVIAKEQTKDAGDQRHDGKTADEKIKSLGEKAKRGYDRVAKADLTAKFISNDGLLGPFGNLLGDLGGKLSFIKDMAMGFGKTTSKLIGLVGKIPGMTKALNVVTKIPGVGRIAQGAMWGARVLAVAGTGAVGAGAGGLMAGLATVGGMAVTAIGAVLASPVTIPLLIGAAVAYGAYWAYKYVKVENLSVLHKYRFAQYGFYSAPNSDKQKILKLESYLSDKVMNIEREQVSFNTNKIDTKELYSIFNIDTDEPTEVNNFVNWFEARFKPIYLIHLRSLYAVDKNATMDDIDKLPDASKLKYIKSAMEVNPSIYSVYISPLESVKIDSKETITAWGNAVLHSLKAVSQKAVTIAKVATQKVTLAAALPKKAEESKNKPTGTKVDAALPPKNDKVPKPKLGMVNAELEGEKAPPRVSQDAGKPFSENDTTNGGGVKSVNTLPVAGGPPMPASTEGVSLHSKNVKLDGYRSAFASSFLGMANEFKATTGKNMLVTSGFRSYADQVRIAAEKPGLAAKPGSSPHEYGLAIDINSTDVDKANELGLTRKYGLTTPVGGEPWHVEPIGIQESVRQAKADPNLADNAILQGFGKGGPGIGSDRSIKKHYRDVNFSKKIMEAGDANPIIKNQIGTPEAKPTTSAPTTKVATTPTTLPTSANADVSYKNLKDNTSNAQQNTRPTTLAQGNTMPQLSKVTDTRLVDTMQEVGVAIKESNSTQTDALQVLKALLGAVSTLAASLSPETMKGLISSITPVNTTQIVGGAGASNASEPRRVPQPAIPYTNRTT